MELSMGWASNLIALATCVCLYASIVLANSCDVQSGGITLEWRQIFVDVQNGPTFSLMVEPDEVVLNLVRDINGLEGISPMNMQLQIGNMVLNYTAQLSEYNIQAGTRVTLIMINNHGHYTTNFIVKSLTDDGQLLQVPIKLGESVASLKHKITQLAGIPQGEQRLLLKGRELKDERNLVHYDIEANTILTLGQPLENCCQIVSINVRTLSGAGLEIEVDLADTVEDLKKKICERTGVPAGVQRLIANERMIAGESHLCDLGLEAGSTVHMFLYSARITCLDQVAMLQEPPVGRHASPSRGPIFHEAEDEVEPARNGQRAVSLFRDARNWLVRDGSARLDWGPDLFDPVAHLVPNPDSEKEMKHFEQTTRLISRPNTIELTIGRLEGALTLAQIKLSATVRSYRVAAATTIPSSMKNSRHRAGINLSGQSTDASSSKQLVSLGADVSNWAPDALSDSDVMRLFEVGERTRQVLARDAQTGEATLSIAQLRQINLGVLSLYLEALAGYPLAIEHYQPGQGEECAICRDELTVEAAMMLPCKHPFHMDCFVAWHNKLSRERISSCPYCKQKFMLSYETLGKTELERPEMQVNQGDH